MSDKRRERDQSASRRLEASGEWRGARGEWREEVAQRCESRNLLSLV